MGAGRKTERVVQQNVPPSLWKHNINTYPKTARNLQKANLASVIFGCKHSTFKECISKQLFGLPAHHFKYVQNVTQGMPLFLFNYSDRKLHGIFEAISSGQMNINPHAWTPESQEMTPYPAQVRVKIRMQCQPLNEDQFQPILADNYRPHEPTHFWFELDKAQTEKLITLFSASPIRQSSATLHPPTRWGNLFKQSIASVACRMDHNSWKANLDAQLGSALSSARDDKHIQKLEAAPDHDVTANQGNLTSFFEEKAWSSLFKSQPDSMPKMGQDSLDEDLEVCVSVQSHDQGGTHELSLCPELSARTEAEETELVVANIGSANEVDDENSSLTEDFLSADMEDAITSLIEDDVSGESDGIEIAVAHQTQNADDDPSVHMVNDEEDTETAVTDGNLSKETNIDLDSSFELRDAPSNASVKEEQRMVLKSCGESSSFSTSSGDVDDNVSGGSTVLVGANAEATPFTKEMISEMEASGLKTFVWKLTQTIENLKSFQLRQNQKIQTLEDELEESKRKIQHLQCHCGKSEQPIPSLPNGHVQETQFETAFQDFGHSMLFLGGFNGSAWLPDLISYSPSDDVAQLLEPMPAVRSLVSAVVLNDELFVIGGRYGASWYDTVESYDLKGHQWISYPPLNRMKGSLAGVSSRDKIFAIGGGNTSECFSEVEMFDQDIGKWIFTRSMTQKRSCPAAAELNGAIYVTGGYDGKEYLNSMERFDPRECSWTSMRSMSTSRSTHSLTVLNEKLYAIGGYDGTQIVPTVEMFEPRVGLWTTLEPMKYARGYTAAVTLGNTICVMGGMQGNEVLDTVECYSEGKGWELKELKAIGKRCCFSAFVV